MSIFTRYRHWRERRELLRRGYDRTMEGGELRLVYTEEKEVFATTPDGSRWKVKPGVIFTAKAPEGIDMNTSHAELIEAGPEPEEPS